MNNVLIAIYKVHASDIFTVIRIDNGRNRKSQDCEVTLKTGHIFSIIMCCSIYSALLGKILIIVLPSG